MHPARGIPQRASCANATAASKFSSAVEHRTYKLGSGITSGYGRLAAQGQGERRGHSSCFLARCPGMGMISSLYGEPVTGGKSLAIPSPPKGTPGVRYAQELPAGGQRDFLGHFGRQGERGSGLTSTVMK